jgi:hypothetical protein
MAWKTVDPVARRNTLLQTAAIVMLIAIICRPSILLFCFSIRELINTIILVVVAFVAAVSIDEWAQSFLRSPGDPWYIRKGATIFLFLALLVMTTIVVFVGNGTFKAIGSGFLMSQNGAVLEFISLQLLWIVLLEWPRYETD